MYHSFLVHSSVDGHLGCFHVLAMKFYQLYNKKEQDRKVEVAGKKGRKVMVVFGSSKGIIAQGLLS